MSETKKTKAETEIDAEEKKKKRLSKQIKLKGIPVYAIVVVSVIVLCVVSIFLIMTNTAFASIRATLITFWVSFCMGIAGDSVYLSVLLLTEKNIELLNNRVIDDMVLMTLLFVLSGGFVAATVQTSTGILTENGLYAVFLLGFGWQGAIAGVAGAPRRKELEELNENCAKGRKALDEINKELEKTIEELKEKKETLHSVGT